jgi:hypothetical protein
MSLEDKIIINWIPTISTKLIYLNESEWIQMIKKFIQKLDEKPISRILKTKLEYFISIGYNIIISNIDPSTQTIYPKFKYLNPYIVLVVIPNVPYFISVQVSDLTIFDYQPKDNKINIDKNYIFEEKLSGFIGFVHELIHCLRYFEGKMTEKNEEENVIYGISDDVLTYDNIYMTENTIRKEWGYNPRVNHESNELLCEDVLYTYKNNSSFTKADFF